MIRFHMTLVEMGLKVHMGKRQSQNWPLHHPHLVLLQRKQAKINEKCTLVMILEVRGNSFHCVLLFYLTTTGGAV